MKANMDYETLRNSMTVQDAARVLMETNCYGTMDIAKNVILKALDEQPRWIPVSERLPKENTAVLIWCPKRKNTYCAYLEEGQWWIFGAHFQKVTLDVIAWMPLPNAYKESEEDNDRTGKRNEET